MLNSTSKLVATRWSHHANHLPACPLSVASFNGSREHFQHAVGGHEERGPCSYVASAEYISGSVYLTRSYHRLHQSALESVTMAPPCDPVQDRFQPRSNARSLTQGLQHLGGRRLASLGKRAAKGPE